jgi:diguanylate cyclase (GGDEF)-like protein/PAS domain S-box-containing protein
MHDDLPLPDLAALVVGATDNAIVVCGPDVRVRYLNPGFTRLLGYTLDELRGLRPMEVLAGPATDLASLAEVRDLDHPDHYRIELLLYAKSGQPLWAAIVTNVVRDEAGSVTCVFAVISDITLTKIHEVLQHRALDAMVREAPMAELMRLVCEEVERIAPDVLCAVLEVDPQGRLRPLAGPSLPASLGHALDGWPIGENGDDPWRASHAQAPEPAIDPLWEAQRHVAVPLGLVDCWSSPIVASDGALLGAFAMYLRDRAGPTGFHRRLTDICVRLCALALERERAKARLEQLATFDMLTGLANRFALKTRAVQVMSELSGGTGSMAVLCIDLHRFKLVNESLGHTAGDTMLREIADRLTHSVRSIDLTGRLDGDEFGVILPACPVQQAAKAAERLIAAIGQPMQLHGATLVPAASIGVAMYPDDGTDIDTLLHHAGMAMVQAKREGLHDGARFFNEAMQQRTRERVALEAALRHDLRDGGLRLHYQPQIDRRSGRLYGLEALARWQHPVLGEIPPGRFIPLAEEAGLIDELGRWALREACRQMAAWRTAGVPVGRVAVNLSTRNFQSPDLVPLVRELLEEHGLAAQALTLEMTESVMLDATPDVLATLELLRELGVHLSLDDFGTGYSSLSYLHRLPIHELKLDQSFVRDLADSPAARALTNTILRIGDTLKLTVVAEGVETEAQSLLLAERGSSIVQGYLFGRPMDADALAAWVLAGPAALGDGVLGS